LSKTRPLSPSTGIPLQLTLSTYHSPNAKQVLNTRVEHETMAPSMCISLETNKFLCDVMRQGMGLDMQLHRNDARRPMAKKSVTISPKKKANIYCGWGGVDKGCRGFCVPGIYADCREHVILGMYMHCCG
jgi:hypothetical protein